MVQDQQPASRIRIRCPHCGSPFKVKVRLIGRRGPCSACGEQFTISEDLIQPSAHRPQRVGRHRRDGSARIGVVAVLVPRSARACVPICFALGGWVWWNTRAESEHYGGLGKVAVYLWWMVYPLLGYYISLGWAGSDLPATRRFRRLCTDTVLQVSNLCVQVACNLLAYLAGMLGVRRARKLCKNIGEFWAAANNLVIRTASVVLGRPASALLIALPQTVWTLLYGKRSMKLPGALGMHVIGLGPACVVLALGLAPIRDHSRYHESLLSQSRKASIIDSRPSASDSSTNHLDVPLQRRRARENRDK